MVTLGQVKEWIATIDDPTLDDVLRTLQGRHEVLHDKRAQAATIGACVMIQGVEPTVLEGLTGEIVGTDEDSGRVAISLSVVSTGRLRFCGRDVFVIGSEDRYVVGQVPASCCYVIAEQLLAEEMFG